MKVISGRLCYRIIFLSLCVLLLSAFPAGLTVDACNLSVYSGITIGKASFDNQFAMEDVKYAKVTEGGNYSSDIDSHEAIYNDNIRTWIFIVLIVFGIYVLAVGFNLYLTDHQKSSR